MAIEKFRFVSPGVQVNEIDDSVLPPVQPAIGPVIIGNTLKGPSMEPVSVSTVADLQKVFGSTFNGNVGASDVWRSGVPTSPTLATYAAEAFLRNASPVTVIRLAGAPMGTADDKSVDSSKAGWIPEKVFHLYAVNSSSVNSETTGTLAAIIYGNTSVSIALSGTPTDNPDIFATSSNLSCGITIGGSTQQFSIDPNSQKFLRNVLNTNPTRYSNDKDGYFLGETFENSYSASLGASVNSFKLVETTGDFLTVNGATPARTPMIVNQLSSSDLFYFESLENGSSPAKEFKISIENVRPSKNQKITKYGTFDVVVRALFETTSRNVLERFSNVNLDKDSDNYIVKRIGDTRRSWDPDNLKYSEDGTYSNKSAYIRVKMSGEDLAPSDLPCGFRIPEIAPLDEMEADLSLVKRPNFSLVESASISSGKTARFGLQSDSVKNGDLVDLLRYSGEGVRVFDGSNLSFFHVDHVSASSTVYQYAPAHSGGISLLTSGSILGFDIPVMEGNDAKNITLVEPFISNTVLGSLGGSSVTNPAHRAIKQALNMISQAEVIDMNILCVPGLQNKDLTSEMIEICRTRGDSLAIIDLEGDYEYPYDADDGRPKSVVSVVNNIKDRAIDNSYGAAYFPAVFVPTEGIYMPASIAALGALGGTEGRSALWFAPAGFNRGGLTQATSGIGVSKTALHLVSSDRDELYDNNINPIATFPNEGVVIFGQKTLQTTPSALDRVNVRRLVNYVKKYISRAATRVLFEPNIERTWDSFKSVVNPFLQSIKANYGLDDAKVVLDSSTTTADLVDRNVMYCKVYIKPTRAIEYIAIDFVVTNSGAAFTE